MIKVDQTITVPGDGDCMRACVASLLDLTIEQVPHFLRYGDQCNIIHFNFIGMLGYAVWGTGYPDTDIKLDHCTVDGYIIACVPSRSNPDGRDHDVVVDATTGMCVHDPNPNKLWQDVDVTGHIKSWYLIAGPVEPDVIVETHAVEVSGINTPTKRNYPHVSIHVVDD